MPTGKKKTVDRIKESLTELLSVTPIEDITATELCKHAKINRATFYYHYDSVQDVVAEIEKQVETEFGQFLSKATITEDGAPEKSFYVTFFEFVARNANICKLLLHGKQRQSEFLSRAMEAGRSKVISIMSRQFPHCSAARIDYYYIFVSNGFLGLLEYWLNSGMRESAAEIAEVGEQVSYNGVKYLH